MNSIAGNIAEGFARYYPKEFAKSLRYSRGSTAELKEHLADAYERGYISADALSNQRRLRTRLSIALLRLIRYLEKCHPRLNAAQQSGCKDP